MRALAGLIVAGPLQAVLVIALCTVLSFLAPPLTSVLSYGGTAALALFSLHAGARIGALVLLGAALVTGILAGLLMQQGMAVVVTSLLLWVPVWLTAVVLRETRSLALAMLVSSGLAMAGVLLVFAVFGDPGQWWLEHLQALIDSVAAQQEIDIAPLREFAEQVAPIMTGALAAGLSFATLTCLLLGRWWQSLLVKPGALRKEFYALRLNRLLSLFGLAIIALAALGFGVVSTLALQWVLVVTVLFLFVGLAVVHATLANLKAARGWLIAIYVSMSLLPQALLLVVVVGMLDPWLDLRRRTAKAETN
jgi:pimeloyl-ACP methyl ester carboxylesterase